MNFKLVAALPDITLGTIAEKDPFGNYNFVTRKMSVRTYSAEDVENQPNFFERVIEFKVNDIVLFDIDSAYSESVFVKLTAINRNFVNVLFQNGVTEENYLERCIRKASELETLNYYINYGWKKGVLVKENGTNNVYVLNHIFTTDESLFCNVAASSSHNLNLKIEDCELIDYYPKKAYEDLGNISGYVFKDGRLDFVRSDVKTAVNDPFLFATRNQCLSGVAFAKLGHLYELVINAYNLNYNCEWIPDFEKYDPPMFFIRRIKKVCVVIKQIPFETGFFPFPTKDLAHKFLAANTILFENYYAV